MKIKRILSIMLVLAMLFALLPVSAIAAETEPEVAEETVRTEQTAETSKRLHPMMDEKTARDRGHIERVREDEGTDLNKLVFRNEDGTKTMYIYDHPVKYRDKQGKTQDISLEISDTGNTKYPFRTKANAAVTEFPASLPDGIKLQGNGVSLRMTSKGEGGRRVDANTVSYTYDSKTTIEYELTYTGFKEDIVVSEYTGQTEYPFTLYTEGLYVTELDGGYYLTDDGGQIRAVIGEIIVFTADERNNTFGSLRVEPVKAGQEYALTIVLDAEYLADPNTVYPIRIDPTVELVYTDENPNAIEERTIQSNNTPNGANTSIFIGYGASGINRVLMRFPGIDFDTLEGVTVTSAVVSLRDLMCETEAMTITCYPFTGTVWDESSSQWSNITQSWGTALDSHVISYDSGRQQESAHRYCFDITSLAQRWVDGLSDPAKGVIFRASASVESGPNVLFKTFASSERSSYRPIFEITYQGDFSLNRSVLDLDEGSRFTLTVSSLLNNIRSVTWASSNTNVAAVSTSGVVTGKKAGEATITATIIDTDGIEHKLECTVYVTVPDGVYYIKNVSYAKCLANDDVTVDSVSTHIEQKNTSSVTDPTQFWQITHLGDGWYSIRPVDRILAVLTADNSGNVVVRDLAENATIHTIYKWKIIQDSSGYIFLHKGLSSSAMTADAASEGSNVSLSVKSANPNCHWKLETAHGVVLRDTTTQRAVTASTSKTIELGRTYSLADLGICCEGYGSLTDVVLDTWNTSSEYIVSVDIHGNITGVSADAATITGHIYQDGAYYCVNYSVQVSVLLIYQTKNTYYTDENGNLAEDLSCGDMTVDELRALDWINSIGVDLYDATAHRRRWETMCTAFADDELEPVIMDMIDHFMGGSGSTYSNLVLTQNAYEHPSTQKYINSVEAQIKLLLNNYEGNITALAYVATDRTSNPLVKALDDNNIFEPVYNTISDKTNGLTICIDSLWGNKIEVISFYISGNTYSCTLRYTLYDHFGLDQDDVEKYGFAQGFCSWYILQNYSEYNKAYMPFLTLIEFYEEITGTLS